MYHRLGSGFFSQSLSSPAVSSSNENVPAQPCVLEDNDHRRETTGYSNSCGVILGVLTLLMEWTVDSDG